MSLTRRGMLAALAASPVLVVGQAEPPNPGVVFFCEGPFTLTPSQWQLVMDEFNRRSAAGNTEPLSMADLAAIESQRSEAPKTVEIV